MVSLLVCTFIALLAQKVDGYSARGHFVELTAYNREYEVVADPFRLIFTQDPFCDSLYQCVCFPIEDATMKVTQNLDGLPECTRQGGFVCGAEGDFSVHVSLDGAMFSVENAELAHLPKPKIQMRQDRLLRQVPVIQLKVQLGGHCEKAPKVHAQHLKTFSDAPSGVKIEKAIGCRDCEACNLEGPGFGKPDL